MRSGVPKVTRDEVEDFFRLDTPASMTLPYPGLDGHKRRITPIPLSLPMPAQEKTAPQPEPKPLSKFGWYWSELGEGWFKTAELLDAEHRAGIRMSAIEDEGTIQEESQLSGTNRSTIGDTFIPPG